MNALDINFDKYIPDIVNALVTVFGKKYKKNISNKINDIVYIFYNNVDGIASYYNFLCNCKRQELTLEFLEKIGIDIDSCKEKSYTEKLEGKLLNISDIFLGNESVRFDKHSSSGIMTFNKNDDDLSQWDLEDQIAIINLITKNKIDLNIKTIDEFKKSNEYQEVLKIIHDYLKIYETLTLKFEDYLEEIKEYDEYVKSERKRLKDIYEDKKKELYYLIENDISPCIRSQLNKNNDGKSKCEKLFSNCVINEKFYIEYFSEEDEKKLNDPSFSEGEKAAICFFRMKYFKSIGLAEDVYINKKKYYEFIENDYVKELIPSFEFVEKISFARERKQDEAFRDYMYKSDTFIKNISQFGLSESNREGLYSNIKDKKTCIVPGNKNDKEFIPLLFFTIYSNNGILDYVLLHEIIHAIGTRCIPKESGYISALDYISDSVGQNPYNSNKRRYERMNETFTDMFAIEARNLLHKKGIYIAEKKEHIIENVSDYNTNNILKQLLNPLLINFRNEIISASIFGKPEKLYNVIGRDQYENINDIINKVDFLIDKGVINKIVNYEYDDPLVEEYDLQVKRLEKIYESLNIIVKYHKFR